MTITEIRPRIIFEEFENTSNGFVNDFNTFIPMSKIGSLLLLESAIITSLARIADAKNIFEFGTYLGGTAATLAKNMGDDCLIYSLDLDPNAYEIDSENMSNLKDANENDEYLRDVFIKNGPVFIDSLNTEHLKKVKKLNLNSKELNVKDLGFDNKFDLIFIDGGHDLDTITNDTNKALEMVKSNAFIIWHDFRSKIHNEVTVFMEEFHKNKNIVHVQNTMLAVMPIGKFSKLFG